MTVTGYCVVCKKKKVPMKDPVIGKTSRGGYMAKGICTNCNKTKMCAMMSKDDAEKAMADGEAKKGF
jgi:hypothetical protein